jgi:hypothetical protein
MPKKIAGLPTGSRLATIYPLEPFVCFDHHFVRLRLGQLPIWRPCV